MCLQVVVGPQLAEHVEAAALGHHHVEHAQIGLFTSGQLEGSLPVGGGHNLVALPLEAELDQAQEMGLIVCDKYLGGVSHGPVSRRGRAPT